MPWSQRIFRFVVLTSLLLPISGCVYGFVYTDVTEPVSENMLSNLRATRSVQGNRQELKEPFSGGGIRVMWASNGIGDVAKSQGLSRIHYADIRTISVLGGIWKRRTVIVHGE
jgi:hypothetical protein